MWSVMAESRVTAASQVHFGARLISPSQDFARSGLCPIPVPSRRRPKLVVVSAQEGSQGKTTKEDGGRRPSEGLFSFVTDNDSSRNAIQLPNAPAQDGNLGQMISVLLCPCPIASPILNCHLSFPCVPSHILFYWVALPHEFPVLLCMTFQDTLYIGMKRNPWHLISQIWVQFESSSSQISQWVIACSTSEI